MHGERPGSAEERTPLHGEAHGHGGNGTGSLNGHAAPAAGNPPRDRPLVRHVSLVLMLAALGVGWKVLSTPAKVESGAPPAPGAAGGAPAAPGADARGGGKARGGGGGLPVVTALVSRKNMVQQLEVTGSLRTDVFVRLGSRIPGRVQRVHAREGDRVREGMLLVELDDSELRAQLNRSQGAMRAAEARLAQLTSSRDYRITRLKKDVEQAESGLKSAEARVTQRRAAARITGTETEARVEAARAQFQTAKERLKIVSDGARAQERRQAAIDVERTKAQAQNARRSFERTSHLLQRGLIGGEEYDQAFTQQRVTEAAYKAALERQSLIQEGARTEEVRVAEQQVEAAQQELRQAEGDRARQEISDVDIRAAEAAEDQARSALDSARAALSQEQTIEEEIRAAQAAVDQARADTAFYRAQLQDTKIPSPVNGVVSTRSVNPGESVTPSSVLFNIVAMNSIYLEAQVPEVDVSQVRPGMSAKVTIDALPGRNFLGTVREVIPVADPAVKQFRVRVAVTGGGDTQLPAGSFGRADIHVGDRRQTLVVPKTAIKSDAGQRYVFTIEEGKAKRLPIETGLADETHVEILKGVQPGQTIIRVASPVITEGARVSVTTEGGAPPALEGGAKDSRK